MTRFTRTAMALGCIWAASAASAGTCLSQDRLHRETRGYEDSGSNFSSALQRVSEKYGVPLGIELDAQGQTAQPISVRLSQGTVADVFDAIIKQAPTYKWVDANGVVNVTPTQNQNALLDVKIKRFHITNSTPDNVQVAIPSLPEVKAWLDEHHIVARSFYATSTLDGKDGRIDQPRASLDVRNITLREILNAIVRKRGFHVWLLGLYGDHLQYLNISIG